MSTSSYQSRKQRPSAQDQLNSYQRYSDARPTREVKEPLGLNCCGSCSRCTLMSLNLVFLAMGIALIVVGAYANNSPSLEIFGTSLAKAIIGVGCFTVLLSLLGFCGASNKTHCSLMLYTLLIVLLIVAQAVMVGLVLTGRENSESLLHKGWKSASNDVRRDVEKHFNCCGFKTMTDMPGLPCPAEATKPCYSKVKHELETRLSWMGYVALALLLLEFVGIISACCLRRSMRDLAVREEEQAMLDDAKRVNRSYA